jgi:hypothetical protein
MNVAVDGSDRSAGAIHDDRRRSDLRADAAVAAGAGRGVATSEDLKLGDRGCGGWAASCSRERVASGDLVEVAHRGLLIESLPTWAKTSSASRRARLATKRAHVYITTLNSLPVLRYRVRSQNYDYVE